ncbi:hypothetical protein DUNSADRAFT_8973 [Dunaliella salina]|uniref:Yippee domain-containing protein n=1 Tax=Dunaliella salina TaxID=3046 RepID=A0ABQ7GIE3_DUNSA|nr:hypothetical protein DUNSADRAFT_8973 [Dunaliella salina]|eukprot:KAF5834387.1 hypothetical protein DUNSADRAFT_8973 [Dunaliella salina]
MFCNICACEVNGKKRSFLFYLPLPSQQFHSKSGRAYLFSSAYNVTGSQAEERMMTTGVHVVQDIFCLECMAYVGWKYISAYDKTQKYKEGKVILERACLVDFDKSSPSPPNSDHTGSRSDSWPGLASSPDDTLAGEASLLLQEDESEEEEDDL